MTMTKRLIDADMCMAKIKDMPVTYDSETVQRCIEVVSNAPTVDVSTVDVSTVDTKTHWIPCSERLPEEPFGCLVTVWDTDPVTMDEFENILPYFVGWDGEQWNDGDGLQCPFEVIAWMPLPKPYEVKND